LTFSSRTNQIKFENKKNFFNKWLSFLLSTKQEISTPKVNLEEFKNFSVKNNTFLLEGEISTKKLREKWKKIYFKEKILRLFLESMN